MHRAAVGAHRTLPSGSFRPDIQGMRGLAVLMVVAYHATSFVPGGYIGVDMFFVLSGFVITGQIMSQVRTHGSIRPRVFFERRIRRLLPLLAVTLTVTSLLGVLLLSPLGASATTSKTAIAAALLNANTFLSRQADDYFASAPDANALLHTWSLSVEEQFYLLFPLLLLGGIALVRRARLDRRTWAIVGLTALAATSFVLEAFLLSGRADDLVSRGGFASGPALAFYGALPRAWEFLVGSLLAVVVVRPPRLPGPMIDALGLAGLLAVIVCAVRFDAPTGRSAASMAIPVVATALLLLAGSHRNRFVTTVLSRRQLTSLGDVSYGWYLFHWPLIVFVAANASSTWAPAAAALVALGLAYLVKSSIEDRFRYDQRWCGRRVVVLGLVCVIVPILAGTLSLAADHVLRIDQLDQADLQHLGSTEGCNRRFAPDVGLDDPECTWKVPDPRGRIVLVGDSHADMWSEAVVEAGNSLGYDVTLAVMSGCPMVAETVRRSDGTPDADCRRYVDRTLAEVQSARPDLVLFGAGSMGALVDDGDAWLGPDGSRVSDVDGIAAIWERGLVHGTTELADDGIRSVIIHDIPYHDVTTQTCGRLRFVLAPSSCATTSTEREERADRQRSFAVDEVVLTSGATVAGMDPLPWLCPDGACSTYVDGTWAYRDGDHLSVAGSAALAPDVRTFLTEQGL